MKVFLTTLLFIVTLPLIGFVLFGIIPSSNLEDCTYRGPLVDKDFRCKSLAKVGVEQEIVDEVSINQNEYSSQDISFFYPLDWTLKDENNVIRLLAPELSTKSEIKDNIVISIVSENQFKEVSLEKCNDLANKIAEQLKASFTEFNFTGTTLANIKDNPTCIIEFVGKAGEVEFHQIQYYIVNKDNNSKAYIFVLNTLPERLTIDVFQEIVNSLEIKQL